jgi:tripartite-type tricarboxylate transporter receptor subunit TctC
MAGIWKRAALAAMALAFAGAARAQELATRPVTMIVPYPAGGVTDTMARLLGERLQTALNRTVVIENEGGGQGILGLNRAARAAPDGQTILFGNLETNVTDAVSQHLNFDVMTAFDPVLLMPSYPFLLASKNDLPARNLKELVAWLKASDGKALQGTVGGVGAAQHLCGLRLQQEIGASWDFVPYRGGAPAMQDMIGGRFDFMCTATGSFLPLVQAGQIRAYAVTAKTRMPSAPDIPTVDEAGLPGFHVGVWNGLWAPKDTPKPIVAIFAEAGRKALADATFRKRMADMGLDMPPDDMLTPEALGKFQKSEADLWWPITKRAMESAAK